MCVVLSAYFVPVFFLGTAVELRVLACDLRGQRVQLSTREKNPMSGSSGLCININPQTIQFSSLKILFIAFYDYRNCRKLECKRTIKKETKNYL